MSSRPQRNATPRGFAVCRGGEATPPGLRNAVVALGNFDGVHRGHRRLIEKTIAMAAERGCPSAVLTFEPHPRKFFAPDQPLFRITPEPVKLRIFEKLGLAGAFVRQFDRALAGTTAAGFVEHLLRDEIGAAGVVAGHDFHFGRGREGTPALLAELCRRHGLVCDIIDVVEEGGQPISSGAIRSALQRGEISLANSLLGYRWFVEGEVRHGDKRGRVLGFPTINIGLDPECGLRHGIYAVRVALGPGEIRDGVASFGRRPTFDDGAPLLEIHLFDFSGDLYGRVIQAEFVGWIRPEERFESVDALVAQMDADAADARRKLASPVPGDLPSMIG
jgi:riboflavin kinase/FMN adenylyltransferase